ncbi:hypothetical protein Are01nite_09560 [Actinoplanes regularis]|nr:hypothetical protein Are01nite_09560 [Actinoplanes regularis]
MPPADQAGGIALSMADQAGGTALSMADRSDPDRCNGLAPERDPGLHFSLDNISLTLLGILQRPGT